MDENTTIAIFAISVVVGILILISIGVYEDITQSVFETCTESCNTGGRISDNCLISCQENFGECEWKT